MDGSNGGSNGPAPFLTKTYEMVDDRVTNSVISWSQSGQSFVVWNPPEFARILLPKYFKHNNFSSFIRQLNTYGFRKIDPDQWEFANEEFLRGQEHLLKHIHRRKPIHSHSHQNQGSSVPLTDSERQAFEEEIQRLKHENNLLQLDLQRRAREKQEFELQVRSLGERLLTMDHRQRKTIAFLTQELQKPRFTAPYMHQSGSPNKKRRLLISNCLYDEANMGEMKNTNIQKQQLDATSVLALNFDLVEKLESSLSIWENYLHGVDQISSEEICDFGVLPQPSPVIITETHALSRNSDVNIQQFPTALPHSSSDSTDFCSSPELAGSSSHVGSPAISSSGIDVNSKSADIFDVDALKERVDGITTRVMPTAANDVFWEQFLRETPGSAEMQDVHSERRDDDDRKSEGKVDHHRYWWNMNNVDNPAKPRSS
ncbi:heat stress transcription factor A-4c-like [Cornus florida]|uniref:heat stress transcription factor A-4c-like n=1 Tax=Cornus florida TaxID=4283 RepID=UPI0028A178C8|nr:heat stress transcription factor A-4c-like [Cornus florida]